MVNTHQSMRGLIAFALTCLACQYDARSSVGFDVCFCTHYHIPSELVGRCPFTYATLIGCTTGLDCLDISTLVLPHPHNTYYDHCARPYHTLRFAFMYAKTVTLGATHWHQTNDILLKNRRIGCR